MSYFSKNSKRKEILARLEESREVRAGFRFPLGVIPTEPFLPDEAYTIEFAPAEIEDTVGDRYQVNISVSAEKIGLLFKNFLELFSSESAMILERWSEDVNREKDIFVSRDVTPEEIRRVFTKYEALWVECGFVGIGVADYASGLELFINDHKIITIFAPSDFLPTVETLLHAVAIPYQEDVEFSYHYEHWHYSLAGLIAGMINEAGSESDFDYYDIINELKVPLDLELVLNEDEEFKVPPRWWYVVVKGFARGRMREFLLSYYIVAETEEEMETLIAEDLEERQIGSYHIYDKCNVNPRQVEPISGGRGKGKFADAAFGIWATSEMSYSASGKKNRMV